MAAPGSEKFDKGQAFFDFLIKIVFINVNNRTLNLFFLFFLLADS